MRSTVAVLALLALLTSGCASRGLPPAASGGSAVGLLSSAPPSSAALSSAAPSSAAPSSAAQPDVVPWTDEPTTRPTVEDPTPSPRPVDARPCSAADLDAGYVETDGAMGTEYALLRFSNVSDSVCVLSGDPTVTATGPGLPDVRAEHVDFPGEGSADMAPGSETRLDLMTTQNCPAGTGGGGSGGPNYDTVAIGLPDAETVPVHIPAVDLICGLSAGPFFVPEPDPPPPGLTAHIEAPPSVAAGNELDYVVDLTNPSDDPFDLEPCPPYEQVAGTGAFEIETLNCDPIGAIAPHQTVRFAMRASIPADEPLGGAKLAWNLFLPSGDDVGDGTVITVTA